MIVYISFLLVSLELFFEKGKLTRRFLRGGVLIVLR